MTPGLMFLLLLALVPTSNAPAAGQDDGQVADRVVLRDGSTVLGQVVPGRSRGVDVVVRRDWLGENLPDRAEGWIERDRASRQRAMVDRARRLRQWQQERRRPEGQADPIATWIDAELSRLGDPDAAEGQSPLIVVSIPRGEISRVDEQPEPRKRMLRQGWRAGFEGVETMPEARLLAGLQDRGFPLGAIDPAPIDDLLPIPAEPDRRWLARRASTEALNDADLRFIRFGDLVLPDPGAGGGVGAVDQAQMAGAVGNLLGSLLGDGRPAADPMKPHLDRVEASGRVGVVVTMLEMAPGFDRVAVEGVLLIRTAPGRWEVGTRRRAEVRAADLPADAAQPLAQDPQVQAAFRITEQLGLGRVDPRVQQQGLAAGAATQRALVEARAALEADLHSVALRVDRGPVAPADCGGAR